MQRSVRIPEYILLEHPNCFAMIGKGDCMEPTIHDGDVLLIDPDKLTGDIMAVEYSGVRHACHLVCGKHVTMICHDNRRHPTIRAKTSDVRILGAVVSVLSGDQQESTVATAVLSGK